MSGVKNLVMAEHKGLVQPTNEMLRKEGTKGGERERKEKGRGI